MMVNSLITSDGDGAVAKVGSALGGTVLIQKLVSGLISALMEARCFILADGDIPRHCLHVGNEREMVSKNASFGVIGSRKYSIGVS
jgi:hypothetical protein